MNYYKVHTEITKIVPVVVKRCKRGAIQAEVIWHDGDCKALVSSELTKESLNGHIRELSDYHDLLKIEDKTGCDLADENFEV